MAKAKKTQKVTKTGAKGKAKTRRENRAKTDCETAQKPAAKISAKPVKKTATATKKTPIAKKTSAPAKAAANPSKAATSPAPNRAPAGKVPRAADISHLMAPLDNRILVRVQEAERITAGGIILPDTAEITGNQSGQVIAVGRGHVDKKGKFHAIELKVGDRVCGLNTPAIRFNLITKS